MGVAVLIWTGKGVAVASAAGNPVGVVCGGVGSGSAMSRALATMVTPTSRLTSQNIRCR